jgi:hypothetical protein
MEKRKAPWPDFAGADIHEGDRIAHPSGETGVVVYDDKYPDRPFRVQYDGDDFTLDLGLQIGDRGQAVVVPT